jgi:hypothetical protein
VELPIEVPADRERKEARATIRILPGGEAVPLPPDPPAPPRQSTQL